MLACGKAMLNEEGLYQLRLAHINYPSRPRMKTIELADVQRFTNTYSIGTWAGALRIFFGEGPLRASRAAYNHVTAGLSTEIDSA
jgi:hypothetical protein